MTSTPGNPDKCLESIVKNLWFNITLGHDELSHSDAGISSNRTQIPGRIKTEIFIGTYLIQFNIFLEIFEGQGNWFKKTFIFN